CRGECTNTVKTLLRIFGQCCQNGLLNTRSNRWLLRTQGGERGKQVLRTQFRKRAMEWVVSTEPLVNHYAECILITCCAWFPLDLLRSHICSRPCHLLSTLLL